MSQRTGSWRAALRIARRGAWRHQGRSALVLVMIGLPVAALAIIDVGLRTAELSPEQQVIQQIGTAADAWISRPVGHRVFQAAPGSDPGGGVDDKQLPGPLPTLGDLVPGVTASLPIRGFPSYAEFTATSPGHLANPSVLEVDYAKPLAAGLIQQDAGRAPRATDEVTVTPALAEALDVGVGDDITINERIYTVVGLGHRTYPGGAQSIFALPGTFTKRDAFPRSLPHHGRVVVADPVSPDSGSGWLVQVPGGVSYAQTVTINRRGAGALSLLAAQNPPDPCSSEVPAFERQCGSSFGMGGGSMSRGEAAAAGGAIALAVTIALLQVVLLVGPAFAIGRRRQAHDLALAAAVGADAKALRRIVLAQGVVLGLAGGLVGLFAGVVIFQAMRPVIEQKTGSALFPTDFRPELLILVGVALVTGVIAAWLPARAASRQDVVAALSGRRGVVHVRRRIPILALISVVAGTALVLSSAAVHNALVLLLGCVVAELGLVALAPTLIATVARAAHRLPLAPRLALRDAARNRMRAGAATAAILAAMAAAVAFTVMVKSSNTADERAEIPDAPIGSVSIRTSGALDSSADFSTVVAALPAERPVFISGPPSAGCRYALQACQGVRIAPAHSTSCTSTDTAAANAWPCSIHTGTVWGVSWLVGTPETLRAIVGHDAPADAVAALQHGGVVAVGDAVNYIQPDGTIDVRLPGRGAQPVSLPAVPLTESWQSQGRLSWLFSPQAYQKLGLPTVLHGIAVPTRRSPTPTEQASARAALANVAPHAHLDVSTQFHRSDGWLWVGVLGVTLLLALAASSIAVGLTNADARPDLATLTAVGASPRTRRNWSASTAAIICVTGCILGTVTGLIIGSAAVHLGTETYVGGAPVQLIVVIPWRFLGALLVVIPLITIGIAWVATRSRLPMVSRIT